MLKGYPLTRGSNLYIMGIYNLYRLSISNMTKMYVSKFLTNYILTLTIYC